jgi:hypothetical protein
LLYFFTNLGARWRWVFNAKPRPLYSRERETVPIAEEAGWAPGAVCMEGVLQLYLYPLNSYYIPDAEIWNG